MTLTLSKSDADATPPSAVAGVRLLPVGPGRWRAVDPAGRAIGHLHAASTLDGVRYSARRYHVPTGRYRSLGDFWSAIDAVECLRLAR